jgi:hypothetical protein
MEGWLTAMSSLVWKEFEWAPDLKPKEEIPVILEALKCLEEELKKALDPTDS